MGYSVLVDYESFLSNFFSLAPPPQLFFSINCIRNKLVHVSFVELFDFIIYQHLNKRTKILPLATSQIAHLCNQLIMFARGGVEDTRLEAKAKDTKKIRGQGQGQPFRGQTLSRPRQECSRPRPRTKKKKKGLHKNFSGDLHKKTFSKKFFKRSTKF